MYFYLELARKESNIDGLTVSDYTPAILFRTRNPLGWFGKHSSRQEKRNLPFQLMTLCLMRGVHQVAGPRPHAHTSESGLSLYKNLESICSKHR